MFKMCLLSTKNSWIILKCGIQDLRMELLVEIEVFLTRELEKLSPLCSSRKHNRKFEYFAGRLLFCGDCSWANHPASRALSSAEVRRSIIARKTQIEARTISYCENLKILKSDVQKMKIILNRNLYCPNYKPEYEHLSDIISRIESQSNELEERIKDAKKAPWDGSILKLKQLDNLVWDCFTIKCNKKLLCSFKSLPVVKSNENGAFVVSKSVKSSHLGLIRLEKFPQKGVHQR